MNVCGTAISFIYFDSALLLWNWEIISLEIHFWEQGGMNLDIMVSEHYILLGPINIRKHTYINT
jgi:hypothetical protein